MKSRSIVLSLLAVLLCVATVFAAPEYPPEKQSIEFIKKEPVQQLSVLEINLNEVQVISAAQATVVAICIGVVVRSSLSPAMSLGLASVSKKPPSCKFLK